MDRLQEPPSMVIANASGKFCRIHANISNRDALVVWYRSGLRLGADVKLSRILISAPCPVKMFSRPIFICSYRGVAEVVSMLGARHSQTGTQHSMCLTYR